MWIVFYTKKETKIPLSIKLKINQCYSNQCYLLHIECLFLECGKKETFCPFYAHLTHLFFSAEGRMNWHFLASGHAHCLLKALILQVHM